MDLRTINAVAMDSDGVITERPVECPFLRRVDSAEEAPPGVDLMHVVDDEHQDEPTAGSGPRGAGVVADEDPKESHAGGQPRRNVASRDVVNP